MKKLLGLVLLIAASVGVEAQSLVNCAPSTPCTTVSGPSNTGTGDAAWLAFGKLNADITSLWGGSSAAFNSVTGGTNTTAAMLVGTGASLGVSGTGTIAATSLAAAAQVLGFDTPQHEGAVGNGIANDTVHVQACLNTGACALPCGSTFLVNAGLTLDNAYATGNTLIGCGTQSVITATALAGPILTVGGATAVYAGIIENITFAGSATDAMKIEGGVQAVEGLTVMNIFANGTGATWENGFYFEGTYDDEFVNLSTGGANIGGEINFTTNVAGATSGTLATALQNGKHDFIFYSGEQRVVTVSGGTAASWPIALAAAPTLATSAPNGPVVIAGTSGQFTCASCGNLQVGQYVTISGTLGGTGTITSYANPTTYMISATNGSTTFTLQTTVGGAIVTTAGTPTGLTYTLNTEQAYYGSDFFLGGAFNGNTCINWQTEGLPGAYNFYMGDDNLLGSSGANTFDGLVGQGAVISLYVGYNTYTDTFNSYYSENTVRPLVLGSLINTQITYDDVFNSGIFSGPSSAHRAYALRVAAVDIDYAQGVTFNSPDLGGYGIDSAATITFSGGGGSQEPYAEGIPNAQGIIRAVAVTNPGVGCTSNMTGTFGGTGTGASATFVCDVASGQLYPANVTLSAGGTGWTNQPIIPLLYNQASGILINSPWFQSGPGWGTQSGLWPWVGHGSASGAKITILNDNAQSMNQTIPTSTPADFICTGGQYAANCFVKYLNFDGLGSFQTALWLNPPFAFP